MRTAGEETLSYREIADRFHVKAATLHKWERAQWVTPVRTGTGHRRYKRSEIEAAIANEERIAALLAEQPPDDEPEGPAAPSRGNERRRALELLHAADVQGARAEAGEKEPPYARKLVAGVEQHRSEIDDLLRRVAEHWPLERMPVVDRNLLRIGVFELLHTSEPTGAVVHEAVRLAKLLSTEESGRFVNGVLGRIARDHRS